MNDSKLTYKQFNENSLLIEWPQKISLAINEEVHTLSEILAVAFYDKVIDIIPTYQSLTIVFNETLSDIESLIQQIEQLYYDNEIDKNYNPTIWQLPVSYDESHAYDLMTLAKIKGLSKEEVIRLHSEPLYTVYFIGFLPGFLYLGGLHKALHISRKETPKRMVPKGAVAIGGMQTGVYPEASPGGWYVIGNCPVTLFDSSKSIPTIIKPRDQIKFIPISNEEYHSKSQLLNVTDD